MLCVPTEQGCAVPGRAAILSGYQYFHTVKEMVKSVADKMCVRTVLTMMAERVLGSDPPTLAINPRNTVNERSEHSAFPYCVKGSSAGSVIRRPMKRIDWLRRRHSDARIAHPSPSRREPRADVPLISPNEKAATPVRGRGRNFCAIVEGNPGLFIRLRPNATMLWQGVATAAVQNQLTAIAAISSALWTFSQQQPERANTALSRSGGLARRLKAFQGPMPSAYRPHHTVGRVDWGQRW